MRPLSIFFSGVLVLVFSCMVSGAEYSVPSFSLSLVNSIDNKKLFSVSTGLSTYHLIWSDSGQIFRSDLPTYMGLKPFISMPIGTFSKTHTGFAISQTTRTELIWDHILTPQTQNEILCFDNATNIDVTIMYTPRVYTFWTRPMGTNKGEEMRKRIFNTPILLPAKRYGILHLDVTNVPHHFVVRNANTNETIDEIDIKLNYSPKFYLYNVNSANSYKILSQEYTLSK